MFWWKILRHDKQTINEQASKGLVVVLDVEIQGVKQIKAT
jgi:guanylate kinase